jgi:glycosyltransferase involved in cell wall biosynthesis
MISSFKLAELWQRLGYKVVVICMGSETKIESVSDTLSVHSRKDIFLKDPLNFGICFGFSRYVQKMIKQVQPDHIVVNKILFWSSWSIIGLRLRGYRVLVLTDALVGMTWWPRGFFSKVIMGIGGWTMGWLTLLLADRVVTFFPQPPKLLKMLGIWKKTRVIPTGIDITNYELRITNSKNTDRIVVSYIGRLESVKGVDDYLAVVSEVDGIDAQVVGWYRDHHPLVKQYEKQVRFTGLRDDIPEILSKTDIFVMPSYSEGLSNVIMEAMASGCAVIATEVGGNGFLLQNGVSGLLYPAGDREALKAHIQRLIDDPSKRASLGIAARERIEKEFSWEVVGKQYQQLFHAA